MKYIIKNKPMWKLEAVCCIASNFKNEEEKVIENSNKFGYTKEQMSNFLDKYITYKSAVLNEVLPIFNKKYSALEPYFKPNDLGNPIIVGFVQRYDNKLNSTISDADIDTIIIDMLNMMVHDLLDEEASNYNFTEIGDVIVFLNKAQLDNDIKMQIINFHIDRYNLTRMIVNLLDEIAPICEKYFFLIEEEFNKTYDYLTNVDDLYEAMKLYVNINTLVIGSVDVYINIFFFNQLSMRAYDGQNTMFAGIHIFKMCELSDENKYNDTQMVASLKSLADNTRYKIICMLSEKSMYMQEIADKLGLTAANVSHHINMLLQYDVISIILDSEKNKRIYYELNKTEIARLAEALNSIIK